MEILSRYLCVLQCIRLRQVCRNFYYSDVKRLMYCSVVSKLLSICCPNNLMKETNLEVIRDLTNPGLVEVRNLWWENTTPLYFDQNPFVWSENKCSKTRQLIDLIYDVTSNSTICPNYLNKETRHRNACSKLFSLVSCSQYSWIKKPTNIQECLLVLWKNHFQNLQQQFYKDEHCFWQINLCSNSTDSCSVELLENYSEIQRHRIKSNLVFINNVVEPAVIEQKFFPDFIGSLIWVNIHHSLPFHSNKVLRLCLWNARSISDFTCNPNLSEFCLLNYLPQKTIIDRFRIEEVDIPYLSRLKLKGERGYPIIWKNSNIYMTKQHIDREEYWLENKIISLENVVLGDPERTIVNKMISSTTEFLELFLVGSVNLAKKELTIPTIDCCRIHIYIEDNSDLESIHVMNNPKYINITLVNCPKMRQISAPNVTEPIGFYCYNCPNFFPPSKIRSEVLEGPKYFQDYKSNYSDVHSSNTAVDRISSSRE